MAAEGDETCFDVSVSDYDSNAVTLLQAQCRGWFVRKKLKEAQVEFEQIVQELDGPAKRVEWTESVLPHPIVSRESKRTRAWKNQDQRHVCKQTYESKSNTSEVTKQITESQCPKCAERTPVHTETESVVPVISKPDSNKTQSDQEVQTEFLQTNKKQLEPKETNPSTNGKCETDAMDILPVKEVICEKESDCQTSQNQDSVEDSVTVTVPKGLKQHTAVSSDTDKGNPNVAFSLGSGSGTVASSASQQPSSQAAVSSDGLTVVTDPASESSSMRRIDSFHGDQTSVWDSSSSVVQDHKTVKERSPETGLEETTEVKLRSLSTEELVKQRQNVAMELLWVQQAIISRKKYLKLKMQMDAAS
ncbi:uncharacterized protein LOC143291125 [Babylonia areolata]|uniref:uncharacterized protein LOC143291125 n=1 Tax=Babylonia areolata TaxID=304850 RepID=UPI003FCF4A7F